MNKKDLIKFLEPFNDEMKIFTPCTCKVSAKHVNRDGEWIVVIRADHDSSHKIIVLCPECGTEGDAK